MRLRLARLFRSGINEILFGFSGSLTLPELSGSLLPPESPSFLLVATNNRDRLPCRSLVAVPGPRLFQDSRNGRAFFYPTRIPRARTSLAQLRICGKYVCHRVETGVMQLGFSSFRTSVRRKGVPPHLASPLKSILLLIRRTRCRWSNERSKEVRH